MMIFAEGEAVIDTGDTAFNMISAALVFLMTPALAFFYGGMVRKKNVLNTLMNSFVMVGLISIQWVLIGYTLAFGSDKGGIIGPLTSWDLSELAAHLIRITQQQFLMPDLQCIK
jgi:Amt family ammonium transporter